MDEDEEDQERHEKQCDAEDCMQPRNQILNWIQCAGCSKWYHYECANRKSHPKENEDYLCKNCRNILQLRKPLIR